MSKHGGENRFAGPAVFTEGGKFEPIRVNAVDAQLLDSRGASQSRTSPAFSACRRI